MEEMTEAIHKRDVSYVFQAGEYLSNPGVKIDYIYSNNSNMDSPFYYDIVRICGGPKPVYLPVPILMAALKLTLPYDDELRSDPAGRALEVAYALREYNYVFDMRTIVSKKIHNRSVTQ